MSPSDAFGLMASRQSIFNQSIKSGHPTMKLIRRALGWREDGKKNANVPLFRCPYVTSLNQQLHRLALAQLVNPKIDLKKAWTDGILLQKEIDDLLEEFGEKIWGTSLESRSAPDSALLPAGDSTYPDLLWSEAAHRRYTKLQLEHLAYVKAIYKRSNNLVKENRKIGKVDIRSTQKRTHADLSATASPPPSGEITGERKSARHAKRPKLFYDDSIITGDEWLKALKESDPSADFDLPVKATDFSGKNRKILICTRCRAKRVRCDRQWPCSRCLTAGLDQEGCVYLDQGTDQRGVAAASDTTSSATPLDLTHGSLCRSTDPPLSSVPTSLDSSSRRSSVTSDKENTGPSESPGPRQNPAEFGKDGSHGNVQDEEGQTSAYVPPNLDVPGLAQERTNNAWSFAGEDYNEDPVNASSPTQSRAHRERLRLQKQASESLQAFRANHTISHSDYSYHNGQEENSELSRADSILGPMDELRASTVEPLTQDLEAHQRPLQEQSSVRQDVEQSGLDPVEQSEINQEGPAQQELGSIDSTEHERMSNTENEQTGPQDDAGELTTAHGPDRELQVDGRSQQQQEDGPIDRQDNDSGCQDSRQLEEDEGSTNVSKQHASARLQSPAAGIELEKGDLDDVGTPNDASGFLSNEGLEEAQYDLLDLIYKLFEQAKSPNCSAVDLWKISNKLACRIYKIWDSEKDHILKYRLPSDGRSYNDFHADGDLWLEWWNAARRLGKVIEYHPFETRERPRLTSRSRLAEVYSDLDTKTEFKRTLHEVRKQVRERDFGDEAKAEHFLENVAWVLCLFTGDRHSSENGTYVTFKEDPEDLLTHLWELFEKLKKFELRLTYSPV